MNYLELCQRLRQEAGGAGTGPAKVTDQTGEARRFVDWTAQAWVEIQSLMPDWRFLLARDDSLSCTAGSQDVGLPADFKRPLQLHLVDGTYKHALKFMDLPDFRMAYTAQTTATAPPSVYTLAGGNITFNSKPGENYPLILDYYTKPVVLSANTDIPALDTEYHMLIVYKALEYYGFYENAPEVLQKAQLSFRRMLNFAMAQQGPDVYIAGPLA